MIDSETEDKLTAEISELWTAQKNGKAAVKRTRAELKSLRLALAGKLHAMKQILVGTGREGGWAPYLRSHGIPVATADRRVAEHEATLAAPEEKLLTEELTLDGVRKLAKKMLPKVQHALITQELVYEFVHELVWNIDVAEASYTENGLEIPRTGSSAIPPEGDSQVVDSSGPVLALSERVLETL
jgi:hypothetical protein